MWLAYEEKRNTTEKDYNDQVEWLWLAYEEIRNTTAQGETIALEKEEKGDWEK